MVFLAICDTHYNLTVINIGENGSKNDCGVLLNSRMGRKFEQNGFNILPSENITVFCCI